MAEVKLEAYAKFPLATMGEKKISAREESLNKDMGIWKDKIQLYCQLCAIVNISFTWC